MSKKTKYLFILKDLDIDKIHQKYGIKLDKETSLVVNDDTTTTKLSELNNNKGFTPETISFLDESKKLHTCHVSMIDFTSKMDVNLLRYHCFWCKHPFDSRPLGCPINYVSPQVTKKYYSHISRDNYIIKENITKTRLLNIEDKSVECSNDEYYETDGVFCSFNCCKAYINENKHNRLYDKSDMLLTKMYNNIMNTKTVIISPAPHWRILEHYGGNLNIIQFRESFNKIDYDYHGTTKLLPKFHSIGTLFEEKIKF